MENLQFSLPKAFERDLGDSNDEDSGSYFVDGEGNALEPYSLAWRYLGMYIDCDLDGDDDDEEEEDERSADRTRNLGSGDSGDDCSRKVLWAAYRDPRYRGGAIGEYQFYDWKTDIWNKTTCVSGRCARMDCHEPRSHYRLFGIFKETDGLYDWAEQLFKHQGYCVWDGDKEHESGDSADGGGGGSDYEFMSGRVEGIDSDCTKMYLTDSSGNTVYRSIMPLPEGNMTYAMYTDENCVTPSDMTWPAYVLKYYSTYYYSSSKGAEQAAYWETVFERWNSLMNSFKVCQPCRAYNTIVTEEDDGSGDNEEDDEDADGGGAAEPWGYNCYDDAGYRNCNQCYKFETHTDLELASETDLKRASAQGTILRVKYNGKWYGKGGYSHPVSYTPVWVGLSIGFLVSLLFIGKRSIARRVIDRCTHYKRRIRSHGIKDTLTDFTEDVGHVNHSVSEGFGKVGSYIEEITKDKEKEQLAKRLENSKRIASKQKEEIDRLNNELSMERTMRDLERTRLNEYTEQLEEFSVSTNDDSNTIGSNDSHLAAAQYREFT